MKKKVFMLLCLLASFVGTKAETSLSVTANLPLSGSGYITVELTNDEVCQAFQLDITLPEGITFVENSAAKGDNVPGSLDQPAVKNDNRELRFVYAATGGDPIPANAGTILTFRVATDITESVAVGEKLSAKGTLSNIKFGVGEDGWTPADQEFDITVTDGRIVFSENDDRLPLYEENGTANVKMKRTITGGRWSTIVLPFTLTKAQAEEAFGTDMKLARFTGFTTTYPDDSSTPEAITVNFSNYALGVLGAKMMAGVPYLIKTGSDVSEFEADGVTLSRTVSGQQKSDTNLDALEGTFTGSLVKTQVPDNGLFISNETFYYSTGATNIKAFRGWFDLTPVLGEETVLAARVTYAIDGTPTAIEGVKPADVTENGAVYTIGGQLVGVDVPKESLKKGIYIKNGKKHIVK